MALPDPTVQSQIYGCYRAVYRDSPYGIRLYGLLTAQDQEGGGSEARHVGWEEDKGKKKCKKGRALALQMEPRPSGRSEALEEHFRISVEGREAIAKLDQDVKPAPDSG